MKVVGQMSEVASLPVEHSITGDEQLGGSLTVSQLFSVNEQGGT